MFTFLARNVVDEFFLLNLKFLVETACCQRNESNCSLVFFNFLKQYRTLCTSTSKAVYISSLAFRLLSLPISLQPPASTLFDVCLFSFVFYVFRRPNLSLDNFLMKVFSWRERMESNYELVSILTVSFILCISGLMEIQLGND